MILFAKVVWFLGVADFGLPRWWFVLCGGVVCRVVFGFGCLLVGLCLLWVWFAMAGVLWDVVGLCWFRWFRYRLLGLVWLGLRIWVNCSLMIVF